jgi:hypothetical protein
MLASIRLSKCTMQNRQEAYIFSRRVFLSEKVMRNSGCFCYECNQEIAVGDTYAAADFPVRLCRLCYADMSSEQAYASVKLPYHTRIHANVYRGVIIHDLGHNGCAIIREDGTRFDFSDMGEAQAFIDATYAMCGGLLGALA